MKVSNNHAVYEVLIVLIEHSPYADLSQLS